MNTIHDTGFGTSELAQRAKAFYETHVAPTLTDADYGKHLSIDLDTGVFVLDADHYRCGVQIVAQNPGGHNRYGARIGFRTAINAYGARTVGGKP